MNGHGDPELAAHFAADLEDDGALCRECRSDDPGECYCDKLSPAPEWQSWPMITAGDGRHYRPGETLSGERAWWPIDRYESVGLTDAEIAALGPVRRAVVVTVPDEPKAYLTRWNTFDGEAVFEIKGNDMPLTAMGVAAEIVAAALREEGEER